MSEDIEKLKEAIAVKERTIERKTARISMANIYIAERRKMNELMRENGYPESAISDLAIGKKLLEMINAERPDLAKWYSSAVGIIRTADSKTVAPGAQLPDTKEETLNELYRLHTERAHENIEN